MLTELIISFVVVVLFIGVYYAIRGFPPGARIVIKKPVMGDQLSKDQAKFMFFYTSWCPHCKKAQQPWYSFKELLKNRDYTFGGKEVVFEEINCEADRGKAALYQIAAYPTFKLETSEDLFEMEGPPNADTFRAFLKKSLGPEKVV
jgi:thiol-disulfide isomerase/thioredoxin